jgi:hypothetical protein
MAHPTDNYWRLRLEACRKALEENNFEAFVAQTPDAARRLFAEKILPGLEAHSAAWGDSMTTDQGDPHQCIAGVVTPPQPIQQDNFTVVTQVQEAVGYLVHRSSRKNGTGTPTG